MTTEDDRPGGSRKRPASIGQGWRGGRGPIDELTALAVALAAVTLVGMFLLRPSGDERPDISQFGAIKETYNARVESARLTDCGGGQPTSDLICQALTIRILAGPDKGTTFTQQTTSVAGTPRLAAGDRIVVGHQENAEPGFEYSYVDRQRRMPLFWLAAMFALAVLLLGRLRGLTALAGFGASFVVLLVFVVPSILDGRSPLAVSLFGASAIAYLALYLSHGFSRKTTIALLGTLGGLGVTAILAAAFQGMVHITGFASEEARYLQAVGARVNLTGLLLGGVIIGALGAIDDITVTQASAVRELHDANPSLGRARLFKSGMRIGRDHVASTVNTLALAYVGASMPVLLLFVLSSQSLGTVANGEIVATEIFRTLVGSIGLIASVPITTFLAARFAGVDDTPPRPRRQPQRARTRLQASKRQDQMFIPERKWDAFLDALRGRPPSGSP
jgi:uncharacterized membrane protein